MSESQKPDKWDWTMGRIVHIDVETTGLVRPGLPMPLLLEVAVVLTDGDLRILGSYEAVIRTDKAAIDALEIHEVVQEMHSKNGLWEALKNGPTVPLDQVELAMIDLLDQYPDPSGNPIVWAGFSPSAIDRPMIAANMPSFYKRIHHRTIDVSTLKLVMRNYAGMPYVDEETSHRAMDDTLGQVELLREFRTQAQRPESVPEYMASGDRSRRGVIRAPTTRTAEKGPWYPIEP